jgi:opacity protein-like surface antigen
VIRRVFSMLFVIASLVALSAAGASAAVGDDFESEFPNDAEYACLGGGPAQSGMFKVKQKISAQTLKVQGPTTNGSISYSFELSYKGPNTMGKDVSYSGKTTISQAFSVATGTESFAIPVKVSLKGPEGSLAALSGTQLAYLYTNERGRPDIFLSSGEGSYLCATPDDASAPGTSSGESADGSGAGNIFYQLEQIDPRLAQVWPKLPVKVIEKMEALDLKSASTLVSLAKGCMLSKSCSKAWDKFILLYVK